MRQDKKHFQLSLALLEIPHHVTFDYNDFAYERLDFVPINIIWTPIVQFVGFFPSFSVCCNGFFFDSLKDQFLNTVTIR